MKSCFTGQNKHLWGFSLTPDRKYDCDISTFSAETVKKIVDYGYEENFEIHVMPNISIPMILIKNPLSIWHYFCSQAEAEEFRKNILIDGYYPCCKIV